MNREQWLKERQQFLGGSDIAAVLGLSRYRTQWDVFMSKMIEPKEDNSADGHLEVGRFMEAGVCDWYAAKTGAELANRDPFAFHSGPESWMAASVDATVVNQGPEFGLECKTSASDDGWGPSGTDEVPVDYQLQCHWYMACTGMDRWDVAVLFPIRREFRRYTLKRDLAIEKDIVNRCREWWEKHIVGKEEPDMDGSSGASEWLRAQFPDDSEPPRPASKEEIAHVMEIVNLKKEMKTIKSRLSEHENLLKASMTDAQALTWSFGSVSYKKQTRKTIDSKLLRSKYPDVAAECEKTSETRVLRTRLEK